MTQAPTRFDYDELSCQELVELVTDYLEAAMPDELVHRFERHLDACDGCRIYVEQMRTTIKLSGRLTPEQLSPEAEAALLAAFRGWRAPT
jgi:predicted anti-sigma-YlaC factor YlaD